MRRENGRARYGTGARTERYIRSGFHRLGQDAKGQVVNYISLFSDITKRKEDEQRIKMLAHFDSLTKLPNRALFADRLQHALVMANRNQSKVGLMFLDLDRFKTINDTLGHLAGDQLLQSVAGRLQSCVRESDTLCLREGMSS